MKEYKRTTNKSKRNKKQGRTDLFKPVCWIVIPVLLTVIVVLDALGIYIFNTERLLVLGTGLLVIMLPFFSEIKIKNLTIKRSKRSANKDS